MLYLSSKEKWPSAKIACCTHLFWVCSTYYRPELTRISQYAVCAVVTIRSAAIVLTEDRDDWYAGMVAGEGQRVQKTIGSLIRCIARNRATALIAAIVNRDRPAAITTRVRQVLVPGRARGTERPV